MKRKLNNLLVAASGTGGHIFPALTISNDIHKNWNIIWLGVKNRCEVNLVPKKFKLLTLNLEAPRGKNIILILNYLKVLLASIKVFEIIYKRKINLVFTTGGYISAPSIIAAKLLNIPVILHESNLVPGLVTKYLGRYCNFVLTGFEETNSYLKGCKTIYTGTPLRDEFYLDNVMPNWVPDGEKPLIVIMGGSQGSKIINESIFNLFDFLVDNFRIIHIYGNSLVPKLLKKTNKNYISLDFTNEVASLMQNCDLIISRSGSGSINEIINSKTPSILIPYPNAKNNHQEKNALYLSSKGGTIMIKQNKDLEKNLENNLKRIFKTDIKNKNNKYPIIELMKKNIGQLSLKNHRKEIKIIINSYNNIF
tara:strand:+ start:2966 stop:4060 length:1095 start_codon:yes stop_codon:yes gene_type:complete